jgi:hypothetical protein
MMPGKRTFRLAVVAAVVAAAATAVIFLNLTMLGYAQPRNDPVGKLNPQAALVDTPNPIPVPPLRFKEHGETDD